MRPQMWRGWIVFGPLRAWFRPVLWVSVPDRRPRPAITPPRLLAITSAGPSRALTGGSDVEVCGRAAAPE